MFGVRAGDCVHTAPPLRPCRECLFSRAVEAALGVEVGTGAVLLRLRCREDFEKPSPHNLKAFFGRGWPTRKVNSPSPWNRWKDVYGWRDPRRPHGSYGEPGQRPADQPLEATLGYHYCQILNALSNFSRKAPVLTRPPRIRRRSASPPICRASSVTDFRRMRGNSTYTNRPRNL